MGVGYEKCDLTKRASSVATVGFVGESIQDGLRIRLMLASIFFLALSFMKTTFEAIICQIHATSFEFEKATRKIGGDGGSFF